VDPVLGRILVELQQDIGVIDDLGDRFGVLSAEVDLEGFDRDLGLVDVLGVVDLSERRQSRSRLDEIVRDGAREMLAAACSR